MSDCGLDRCSQRILFMILLLGGTSETSPTAVRLAEEGYSVLVSTATDAELEIGNHPGISRRTGRLTEADMLSLVRERGISAIVDVTHPYAMNVRTTAVLVAVRADIPYFTFIRPSSGCFEEDMLMAKTHEEAAALAFAVGKPVLLTTGSRNLDPYVQASRRTGISLMVRVLNQGESLAACQKAGLSANQLILGRGPFTVSENRATIKTHNVGVLVTKDSGIQGGVEEKITAARLESCKVVIVQRPDLNSQNGYNSIEEMVNAIVLNSKPAQEPILMDGSLGI